MDGVTSCEMLKRPGVITKNSGKTLTLVEKTRRGDYSRKKPMDKKKKVVEEKQFNGGKGKRMEHNSGLKAKSLKFAQAMILS